MGDSFDVGPLGSWQVRPTIEKAEHPKRKERDGANSGQKAELN